MSYRSRTRCSTRRRGLAAAVTAWLLVAVAGPGGSQEPAGAPEPRVESESPPPAQGEPEDAAPAPQTPLAREVRAARAAFGARLDDLNARYAATATPAGREIIARELDAAKVGFERQMLEIHLRHARAIDDTTAVVELEAARSAADVISEPALPAAPAAAAR